MKNKYIVDTSHLGWTINSKTSTLKPDPGMSGGYNRPYPTPNSDNIELIRQQTEVICDLHKQLEEKEEAIKELQLALKQILEVKGGQAT